MFLGITKNISKDEIQDGYCRRASRRSRILAKARKRTGVGKMTRGRTGFLQPCMWGVSGLAYTPIFIITLTANSSSFPH
jgi:hypothetical protein